MAKAVQLVALCTYGCKYTNCEHVLQEMTLPNAEYKGKHWYDYEIAYIRATLDEPLSNVALALGRTYYGTARTRSKVKRGLLT